MRLVSFRADDKAVHVAVVRDGQLLDLSVWLALKHAMPRFDMVDLICMGDPGLELVREALEAGEEEIKREGALVPLKEQRLTAPIPRPRKNVMCLGRNYAEHARESRKAFGEADVTQTPEFPAIFTKAPTAVIGPYDTVPYDASVTTQLDWECELAIVIGEAGKNIQREEALRHVFGYMVLNDVSARDLQKKYGGQYFKGKSLDGSCPTGPWIVTADELGDAGDLEIWTRVNGVQKQCARTSAMMLDVAGTVASLSIGMTLEPGDIIATGTPAGVGHARTPAEYLQPGDMLETGIEKIGSIWNRIGEGD